MSWKACDNQKTLPGSFSSSVTWVLRIKRVTTSTLKGLSEYTASGTLEAEGFVELELEAAAS